MLPTGFLDAVGEQAEKKIIPKSKTKHSLSVALKEFPFMCQIPFLAKVLYFNVSLQI
jgi:hypothetical protein